MTVEIYERVTERIMEQLRQGVVPWQRPWNGVRSWPRNLVSKQGYRGINILLLLSCNYQSPHWLTFRQVNQLGGTVKKGEKACPVVFWKRCTFEEKDTGEQLEIPFLRYYYVFNTAQCDGLKEELGVTLEADTQKPDDCLELARQIMANMPAPPAIKHGRSRACYLSREDQVQMPSQGQFKKPVDYYSTLFHELAHSTGHESRLKRPAIMEGGVFGSDSYGKEELLAEIGASFLCAQAGILDRTIDNSASYINGWLETFSKNTKLIVQAAACAQRAVDYILNVPRPSATQAPTDDSFQTSAGTAPA